MKPGDVMGTQTSKKMFTVTQLVARSCELCPHVFAKGNTAEDCLMFFSFLGGKFSASVVLFLQSDHGCT